MALYPGDIDTAENCLKAAETLGDFELVRKFAADTRKRASWLDGKPGAEGDDARRSMAYAEYALSLLAIQNPDRERRKLAAATLASLNPDSSYLPTLANTTAARHAVTIRPSPVSPAKNGTIVPDLENEEALTGEAERLIRKGADYWKVLDYSQRALRILNVKAVPPGGEDSAQWQTRRNRYITAAQWMSGIAATILGMYRMADRDLRGALPALRDNRPALGSTLYSLGFVNYSLAEEGDRKRIFDALKFNLQCAPFPGAYRDQALKNNESIKVFYNMKD